MASSSSDEPAAKRTKPAEEEEQQPAPRFELRYFPLMAKGLGPALVAEHSGLPWAGNATLGFTIEDHWSELKPTTPFGQLPLLTEGVPGKSVNVAQTTAIVNYIGSISGLGRIFGQQLLGDDRYAVSEQLLAEGEDIFNLMVKFLPTPYKQLSSEGVTTSKGTAEDYAAFWATLLPSHLEHLERLTPFNVHAEHPEYSRTFRGQSEAASAAAASPASLYLPGELYLFSVLHQARLVDDAIFARTPRLGLWYERVRASEPTQRVLRGESPMGVLKQYYLPLGSAEICSLGDERGRWG